MEFDFNGFAREEAERRTAEQSAEQAKRDALFAEAEQVWRGATSYAQNNGVDCDIVLDGAKIIFSADGLPTLTVLVTASGTYDVTTPKKSYELGSPAIRNEISVDRKTMMRAVLNWCERT